jgi:hypothetical protein
MIIIKSLNYKYLSFLCKSRGVDKGSRLDAGAEFCYSIPVKFAQIAQLVEHAHGKGEVIGSIPILGSRKKRLGSFFCCCGRVLIKLPICTIMFEL